MFDFFYSNFIFPIEWFMSLSFVKFFNLSGSYGLGIIYLSIFINFLLLPITFFAEILQDKERKIQKKMQPKISQIKKAFSGTERFMMIRTFYKQIGYHPAFAFRSSLGLFIQIPFFIAAYQLLTNYEPLQKSSFLFINDLSRPDLLISFNSLNINLLPIMMTLVNLLSSYIYSQDLLKKERKTSFLLALFFLVVLYNSTAAIVLYWIINNVFSLIKNIFFKLHRVAGGQMPIAPAPDVRKVST